MGQGNFRDERVSEAFVAAIGSSEPETAEASVIAAAIAEVLKQHPHGGLVDSHRAGRAIVARRRIAGRIAAERQTLDYLQHTLREAAHVCRHGIDGAYRIHPEEKCSDGCDTKYAHRPPEAEPNRPVCPSCFLMEAANGTCAC